MDLTTPTRPRPDPNRGERQNRVTHEVPHPSRSRPARLATLPPRLSNDSLACGWLSPHADPKGPRSWMILCHYQGEVLRESKRVNFAKTAEIAKRKQPRSREKGFKSRPSPSSPWRPLCLGGSTALVRATSADDLATRLLSFRVCVTNRRISKERCGRPMPPTPGHRPGDDAAPGLGLPRSPCPVKAGQKKTPVARPVWSGHRASRFDRSCASVFTQARGPTREAGVGWPCPGRADVASRSGATVGERVPRSWRALRRGRKFPKFP